MCPERLPFERRPRSVQARHRARQIQVSFEHDMAALAVSNISLSHNQMSGLRLLLREHGCDSFWPTDPGAGKTDHGWPTT